MRPEDIMLMGRYEQLLLINGMRPIHAGRMPFWFVAPWAEWAKTNPVEGRAFPRPDPLFALRYSTANELE